MIEERIPFGLGRVLTTAALLLGVLAIIVAACVYLYHVIIVPVVALLIAGFTSGKISPTTFASFIGSMICSAAIYSALNWLLRGNTKLMKEIIETSRSIAVNDERVLEYASQVRGEVNEAFIAIRRLEARMDATEE